jgi:glucose/arabinose dehydrogenase
LLHATAVARIRPSPRTLGNGGKASSASLTGASPAGNRFNSPVFTFAIANPQGFDWHPVSGDTWASEHGKTGGDEINVIQSGRTTAGRTSGIGPHVRSADYVLSSTIAPSGLPSTAVSDFQFANVFVATLRGTHLLRHVDAGARITTQERLLDGT